jgi:NAD(P)-dependent dehydrogenase (short-subunit alcohol dehydrogenase family)
MSKPFDLTGQVALITGGNSGIGLLPGWIDTPMAGPALHSDAFESKVLPRVPVRRWGSPEDFAAAVYPASPATSYHTGDTMVIDGGYSIF